MEKLEKEFLFIPVCPKVLSLACLGQLPGLQRFGLDTYLTLLVRQVQSNRLLEEEQLLVSFLFHLNFLVMLLVEYLDISLIWFTSNKADG